MKERMQKTLSQVNGYPQRDRSETEWYGGVQTFMWMCEDNIVEVPFDKEVRWCERSENESRKKTVLFSSYSIQTWCRA